MLPMSINTWREITNVYVRNLFVDLSIPISLCKLPAHQNFLLYLLYYLLCQNKLWYILLWKWFLRYDCYIGSWCISLIYKETLFCFKHKPQKHTCFILCRVLAFSQLYRRFFRFFNLKLTTNEFYQFKVSSCTYNSV